MPLTAMSDMPDALQGLKRENLLGYEHVLGQDTWVGEEDAMMGLGATDNTAPAWTAPGQTVGAPTSIPLASGMQLQIPDLSNQQFQNPASWWNLFSYVGGTLAQNKILKQQRQDAAHKGKTQPTAPGQSGGESIMSYAPYALLAVVVVAGAAYALKRKD